MANEKTLRTRIQNRHAPESYWVSNSTFVPRAGELIVYDVDSTHTEPRLKFGDGTTKIANLPFLTADIIAKLAEKADKASTVSNVAYDSTNKKITKTVNGTTTDVVSAATLKTAMSLNNVNNTADADKPISTATQAALNAKLDASQKGAANGVASLDSSGKVPSSQLPAYVDDVLEYETKSAFPATGEAGKVYVDKSDNKTYRWSGSAYIQLKGDIALGETSSTAYRGDRGKTAYDHAAAKGSAFAAGLYKIATNDQGHVTGATAVTKSDITGLGIPAQDTTYSDATTSAHGLMSAEDKTKLNGIAEGATSNTGTVTSVATGAGLTGGPITGTGTVKADLVSETKLANTAAAATETQGRVYPVALDKNGKLAVNVPWSNDDTKNTAGSTDSSAKLFLIGAPSQSANPQTYSQDTAYVGTDGCLYSDGKKVLTDHQDVSGKIDKSVGQAVGDIMYFSAKGTPTRLAIGTAGQVLKVVSGVPAWGDTPVTSMTTSEIEAACPYPDSGDIIFNSPTLNVTRSSAEPTNASDGDIWVES